jgi:hypothetical protein
MLLLIEAIPMSNPDDEDDVLDYTELHAVVTGPESIPACQGTPEGLRTAYAGP